MCDRRHFGVAELRGKISNFEISFLAAESGILTNTDQERSTVSKETAFTEGLASLRSLGEVSQIIVDIGPLALPAL